MYNLFTFPVPDTYENPFPKDLIEWEFFIENSDEEYLKEVPLPWSVIVTGIFVDNENNMYKAPVYYDYHDKYWDLADDSPKYENCSIDDLIGWTA